LTAAVAMISIDTATAQDLSALKMSFSEDKISILPEQITPKPESKPSIARNIRRDDRQTGTSWYFGTTRGANFPDMKISNSTQNASWNGNNPFGGLVDLNNINAFAGYKSSNFRLEGELVYATNSMSLANSQNISKNTQTDIQQPPNGPPEKCNATTFGAILNGYYDLDMGGQLKPFVGVGLGYATTNLKGEGRDWGSKSGLTYQLKAGVGYPLSDRQDIYLQYKYINSPAQYVIPSNSPSPSSSFDTNFSSSSIEISTKFNF
jgi:opacity protein-like surface antigen